MSLLVEYLCCFDPEIYTLIIQKYVWQIDVNVDFKTSKYDF